MEKLHSILSHNNMNTQYVITYSMCVCVYVCECVCEGQRAGKEDIIIMSTPYSI